MPTVVDIQDVNPLDLSEELFHKYKAGTKPTGFVEQEEACELRRLVSTLIPLTIYDFLDGRRINGNGFFRGSLTDAFLFNSVFEGLHLSYEFSIVKIL
ncbi:hypothetical protein [Desertivirga brevis]|uniref:hypothetical protein n=1 Tax=Desertivirga brevis TaxID=2810310 RepID=UPI001A97AF47|nr:hypothetical protein [Pedobacter sp. SYSU D00873]